MIFFKIFKIQLLDVVQEILRIENNEAVKSDKLEELVTSVGETNKRTLVFVETKRKADFIACMLSQTNIPTTSIHGGRSEETLTLGKY